MILNHKGRKMTLFSLLYPSRLSWLSQNLFICDDPTTSDWAHVWTVGAGYQPVLGDTVERSWTMLLAMLLFGLSGKEILPSRGRACGLEQYGKIFAIVMTAILFGLFHAIFDQLFFHLVLLFSVRLHCLSDTISGGLFSITFSIIFVISKASRMWLSCGRGTSGEDQCYHCVLPCCLCQQLLFHLFQLFKSYSFLSSLLYFIFLNYQIFKIF